MHRTREVESRNWKGTEENISLNSAYTNTVTRHCSINDNSALLGLANVFYRIQCSD